MTIAREGHGAPSPTPALALFSVLLAPFAFGAVSTNVWVPLAWAWVCLGAWSLLRRPRPLQLLRARPLTPVTRIFLAVHVLFAIQLIPLPSALLRVVSPGSFAAHYIPPTEGVGWAPLTASATGTGQAWLLFAGLHGLALTLFTGTERSQWRTMTRLYWGMAWVGGILALQGLVQSASAHPFWLYGIFPVPGADSHEAGIFGPYYNRDHYSNLIAISASVTASMFANRIPRGESQASRAILNSPNFPSLLGLAVILLLMLAASAASGSRGGLAALVVGLVVGLGPVLRTSPRLALGSAFLACVTLFATGIPVAVARLGDVDFEASRLMVWRDVLRLLEFFPVFGCGIGAFATAYWPYQRVVRFEYWPHAHNEYLQWAIEGGLFGMLVVLFCSRRAWIAAPQLWRNRELRPALAGLSAAAVHALVDCSLRVPANAIWTGLLAVSLAVESGAIREPRGSEDRAASN